MSRAFVKEDAAVDDVLDRPISPHPNYVTAAGLEQIERELETARQTHGACQCGGDRAELAKAASDLRYWSARRSSARVLTPDPNRDAVPIFVRLGVRWNRATSALRSKADFRRHLL